MKERILVAGLFKNSSGGGSGSFMDCVYKTLIKLGYDTEIVCYEELQKKDYEDFDFVICSHQSVLRSLLTKSLNTHLTKILCISQGWIPQEEHFIPGADHYVSISEEVEVFNLEKGGIKSTVIPQPIDILEISKSNNEKLVGLFIKNNASTDNKEFIAGGILSDVEIITVNPRYPVLEQMKDVDFVIGLGRSALEGMSIGKPAIIADTRGYNGGYPLGDGLLDVDNYYHIKRSNYSARARKQFADRYWISNEIHKLKTKYSYYSKWSHEYISLVHNAESIVNRYLELLRSK